MKKIIDYTQTAFYIFQYNTRKINALIKRSQIHRIKVYVMLMAFIFSCFTNLFAIENANIPYGEKDINYVIDENSYISYNGIRQRNTEYYYIQDGEKYTAYCIDLGLNGAEYGEGGHYIVNAQNKIEDKVLKDIILNCYPYKSVEELGVENEDEAKFASQFAIWCYTSGINIYDVLPISDMNNRLVECIHELYNSRNDDPLNHDIDININKKNERLELIDDEINIVCDIEIKGKNINSYTITTKDEYAKVKKDSGKYIIYLPQFVATNGYNVKLDVEFNANENIVLFGTKKQENEQNMAITLSKTFNESLSKQIELETTTTEFKLYKKDIDTNQPIQGAIYKLYSDFNLVRVPSAK